MMGTNATKAVDDQKPAVTHQLVAAGVPAQQADQIFASFKQCAVDRAKEKDPSSLPASCPNPAHPDPNQPAAVGQILAAQGVKAGQQTMINGYETTLWFVAGGQFLVFLLMFFLPKNVRAKGQDGSSGADGDAGSQDLAPVFAH